MSCLSGKCRYHYLEKANFLFILWGGINIQGSFYILFYISVTSVLENTTVYYYHSWHITIKILILWYLQHSPLVSSLSWDLKVSSTSLIREYICLVPCFLWEAFKLMGFKFTFQSVLSDGDVFSTHLGGKLLKFPKGCNCLLLKHFC